MALQEQANIVDACQTHERNHWKDRDYRAAIFIGTDYFVKYGDIRTLATEAATQRYISAYAAAHSAAGAAGIPRIPRVLSYFEHEKTAYIVAEHVKLTGSPLDPESTAAALKWLSEVPLPPKHIFGPLEGGRIRHKFFKNYKAPLRFSTVEALERYIEKVRRPPIHFFRDAPSANIAQSGSGAHSTPKAVSETGAHCPYHRRAIRFHAA